MIINREAFDPEGSDYEKNRIINSMIDREAFEPEGPDYERDRIINDMINNKEAFESEGPDYDVDSATAATAGNKRYLGVLTFLRDIAISFAIALLIVQFINPTIVKGQSMEPTLHDSNYIFLSKKQYMFSEIQRGDIIVFKPKETPGIVRDPDRKDALLIKRVIALPGDELRIDDGEVFINGECLLEPYLLEPYTIGKVEQLVIPEGFVFVMGDNRQHSLDSRSPEVGLVLEDQIIGMAFFRIFPFNQFGLL